MKYIKLPFKTETNNYFTIEDSNSGFPILCRKVGIKYQYGYEDLKEFKRDPKQYVIFEEEDQVVIDNSRGKRTDKNLIDKNINEIVPVIKADSSLKYGLTVLIENKEVKLGVHNVAIYEELNEIDLKKIVEFRNEYFILKAKTIRTISIYENFTIPCYSLVAVNDPYYNRIVYCNSVEESDIFTIIVPKKMNILFDVKQRNNWYIKNYSIKKYNGLEFMVPETKKETNCEILIIDRKEIEHFLENNKEYYLHGELNVLCLKNSYYKQLPKKSKPQADRIRRRTFNYISR